ncbi:MAG: hypothetical protein AAGA90_06505 [Actinomycetota bacterium]
MATAEQHNQQRQVIWTREIDESENTERWRKLGLYYGVPVAIALVLGLVFGGVGAFLGILILAGAFGLLVVGLVFFKNVGAKQNATIVKIGDALVLGQNRVDLTRVEAWATRASEEDWGVRDQAIYGNAMAGDAITARVTFRLAQLDANGERGVRHDGGPAFETVMWQWAMMPPDHLDRMRDTIAPHIPAPLVDPANLTE